MSWLNDNAAEANRRLREQGRLVWQETLRKDIASIRVQLTELAGLLQKIKTRLEGDRA